MSLNYQANIFFRGRTNHEFLFAHKVIPWTGTLGVSLYMKINVFMLNKPGFSNLTPTHNITG